MRHLVIGLVLGYVIAAFAFGPRVSAQQNIVTLYGLLNGSGSTIQAAAVDSSGNLKLKGQ